MTAPELLREKVEKDTVLFREVQRYGPWFRVGSGALVVAMGLSAGLGGDRSLFRIVLWALLGVSFVVTYWLTKMETVVRPGRVEVTHGPVIRGFRRQRAVITNVVSYERVRARWRDGLFGWNWSPKRGWVFAVRGGGGVRIRTGKKVFYVGSARPDELAAAIAEATGVTEKAPTPDPQSVA